ncbi:MAG: hypothetical protein IT208_07555 [Chthonomonadales bacterium]|nr:hypothetical protein [Chthonomonadales bacterium]
MKVRVSYRMPDMTVDEAFEGPDAEAIVAAMKARVAARAGFAIRLMVSALSPLRFAQEAVRRYNSATDRTLPIPSSCEEFLTLGVTEGIVVLLAS